MEVSCDAAVGGACVPEVAAESWVCREGRADSRADRLVGAKGKRQLRRHHDGLGRAHAAALVGSGERDVIASARQADR